MKLITELTESVSCIAEAKDGKKYYYLEGIFMQSELKNRNGRVYPKTVMESGLNKYITEKVTNRTSYGELGHPAGPTINPERISHLIETLEWDGNNVVGRAKVLDTDYGIIAQKILEGGGRLGVSSRALGSLKPQNGAMYVQEDFYISTAADIVTDPSAPEAFVNGIMEGQDWVFRGGAWVPQFVEQSQQIIKKAPSRQLEEKKLEIWKKFLANL